jgi:prophage DNA circulation protein
MASWRDNLQPASFRGVSFGVFESSLEGGRRTVSHEYPQRDTASIEDLGLKARGYSVEAFVVGDDYMTSRNALQSALELGGSGILVHPYYGTQVVFVDSYSIRESANDGGMASFTISFLQESSIVYPAVSQTAASTLASTITSASTNSAAAMSASYASGTGAVATQAASDVTNSIGIIQAQSKLKVRSASAVSYDLTGQVNNYDAFMRDSEKIAANAGTLIQSPETLSYDLTDITGRLVDMTSDPALAVTGYSAMFDALAAYFSGLAFLSTTTGAAQQENANLLRDVLLLSVASSAASAAVTIDFTTKEDAIDTRDAITDMLGTFMTNAVDDSMFETAQDLRASVASAIPPPGTQLKDITTVDVPSTTPSLVLAWSIYGEIDSERDLVTRNDIASPWAIRGGSSLEVLL